MSFETQIVNGHLAIKKVIPPKTVHLTELAINEDLSLIGLVAADSGSYYAIQAVGAVRCVNLPLSPVSGFIITIINRGTTYEITTMRDGNPLYNISPGDSLTLVYGTTYGYFYV